ncbi:MAG: GIY-YIG nuclease family protein [Candidatus Dojkabacteria bacterium]
MLKNYFVYILKCSDNSYYTGVTNNLELRLSQHSNSFNNGYTSTRLPVKLVWSGEFNDIRIAITFEKKLKNWSRKKKEALINNDWESLKFNSLRKTPNK